MNSFLRQAACLAIASALFIAPAPVKAQTLCEYGAVMAPAQAAGSAALAEDASTGEGPAPAPAPAPQENRPALGGIGDLMGRAGTGVVSALGGDTAPIDQAMEQQREREREVGAVLGLLAALPC